MTDISENLAVWFEYQYITSHLSSVSVFDNKALKLNKYKLNCEINFLGCTFLTFCSQKDD